MSLSLVNRRDEPLTGGWSNCIYYPASLRVSGYYRTSRTGLHGDREEGRERRRDWLLGTRRVGGYLGLTDRCDGAGCVCVHLDECVVVLCCLMSRLRVCRVWTLCGRRMNPFWVWFLQSWLTWSCRLKRVCWQWQLWFYLSAVFHFQTFPYRRSYSSSCICCRIYFRFCPQIPAKDQNHLYFDAFIKILLFLFTPVFFNTNSCTLTYKHLYLKATFWSETSRSSPTRLFPWRRCENFS